MEATCVLNVFHMMLLYLLQGLLYSVRVLAKTRLCNALAEMACHLLRVKWNCTSCKVVQLPTGFTFLYKSLHFNHSSENFEAVILCAGICFQHLCLVFLLLSIHDVMIKTCTLPLTGDLRPPGFDFSALL